MTLSGQPAAAFAVLSGGNAFTGSQSIVSSTVGTTAVDVQATELTTANKAVSGRADGLGGVGVYGEANNGTDAIGVWGLSDTGFAGQFDGDVNVTGDLDVTGAVSKSGGSFRIDHPLDPAHKFLLHSFVESPDMMNIYNGNAMLDAKGEATIVLPEWFEALNRDFRYQLTAIGVPGPSLFIAAKIQDNHFKIGGGTPGMEVSWEVTGVRHDAWANAHRIPVEVRKSAHEDGHYLHPQLFGAPREMSLRESRRALKSPR